MSNRARQCRRAGAVSILLCFHTSILAAAPLRGPELQRVRLSLRALVPEPAAGDTWRAAAAPGYFGPEELAERAGQNARVLADLGFRQGIEARFRDARGETRVLVYDLGGVLHAFAAAEGMSTKGARPAGLGRRGYQNGDERWFCAGRYLVTVSGPAAESVAARAARATAAADGSPNLFDWLPPQERVAGSERALPNGPPGMGFLGGAAGATYRARSKEVNLLLFGYVAREESTEVFSRLAQHFRAQGRGSRAVLVLGEQAEGADVKPLGPTVAMRLGRFIVLASGTGDTDALRAALSAAADTLTRKAGGEAGLK